MEGLYQPKRPLLDRAQNPEQTLKCMWEGAVKLVAGLGEVELVSAEFCKGSEQLGFCPEHGAGSEDEVFRLG